MTIPEYAAYKNENGETPPSDFTNELAEKYVKYKTISAVISPAAKLVKGNDVLPGLENRRRDELNIFFNGDYNRKEH
ncbi:hypothetical protein LJC10_05335 [Selenomonadales bacterium OttesenSCG-928-I06]|nr:hypothetical protein [Selenomonadales bacterium OttesenSCG-928-I06]